MTNQLVPTVVSPNPHPLPGEIRTRSGVVINPRLDRWAYQEGVASVNLDFSSIQGATPLLIGNLKLVLAWYVENKSPNHLVNMYGRLVHLLKIVGSNQQRNIAQIIATDLINYREALPPSRDWYLSSLAGLIKKWHGLGFPGVSDDAIAFLNAVRLQGNKKGNAVRTMDLYRGPYSDIELQAIQIAVDDAYAMGKIDRADYLLAWLFMLLGQRPMQYALLKVCDVVVGTAKDGSSVYSLRVPRVKQRRQFERMEFKERLLISQIGSLLAIYAQQVRAGFDGRLADPTQAPLFPCRQTSRRRSAGYLYHQTSSGLRGRLKHILMELDVPSERTGESLRISATRFRRTIGTRAAAEGHGELIIAEMLDHSDTQNVSEYVNATPAIVERIDRAIALEMAPLAQAFAGLLIADESEAVRGDDHTSRIVDPRFDKSFKPVGNCGKHGFCGFSAPIACYTCRNFQPWVDGPHEAVLEHLLAERERLLKNTDSRIASVNDRTILAVAEVVQLCDAFRDERESMVANG